MRRSPDDIELLIAEALLLPTNAISYHVSQRLTAHFPDTAVIQGTDSSIRLWNGALQPALRLDDEGAERITGLTDGFSFAYLKELFLASIMAWISAPQPGTMAQVMVEQLAALRAQVDIPLFVLSGVHFCG